MSGPNLSWVTKNWEVIAGLAADHIALALPAILGTFLLTVPLGYAAHRLGRRSVSRGGLRGSRRAARLGRGAIITAASMLYAIPALALFVILPLVLRTSILSPANVVIALWAYGVALKTRVVAEAFDSRDATVAHAAEAVGFNTWRQFWQVDLPLAGPGILAGMRVVSASTLSLVSVGALIGVPSLGNLLTDGFLRSFPTQILTGVLGIVLLAVVFDLLILGIGRVLMPWRREAGL